MSAYRQFEFRCDQGGCDRRFRAWVHFSTGTPASAAGEAPVTEQERECGLRWHLPGSGEPTTAPIYCPTHNAHARSS